MIHVHIYVFPGGIFIHVIFNIIFTVFWPFYGLFLINIFEKRQIPPCISFEVHEKLKINYGNFSLSPSPLSCIRPWSVVFHCLTSYVASTGTWYARQWKTTDHRSAMLVLEWKVVLWGRAKHCFYLYMYGLTESAARRPKLNLLPRTSREAPAAENTTRSSIFGTGRPRDEKEFEGKPDPKSDTGN